MGTKNVRKYYLDWLRVLAILAVFIYHSTKFFDLGNWHVKNSSTYLEVRMPGNLHGNLDDAVYLCHLGC